MEVSLIGVVTYRCICLMMPLRMFVHRMTSEQLGSSGTWCVLLSSVSEPVVLSLEDVSGGGNSIFQICLLRSQLSFGL